MYIIENENARKIIEILVPKEILDLKPVIAGGMIVSLYYAIMKYSSPVFDDDIKVKIEQYWGWGSKLFSNLGLDNKFGDIDFWFLKDNDIWNPDSIGYPLVKYDIGSAIDHGTLTYFKLNPCTKASYWANTFSLSTVNYEKVPVQFIKKTYESIEELFLKFDLINCCAAYYDGCFYLHDAFEKYHRQHLLMPGNSFNKKTFLGRVWTINRCFKYFDRYQLQFSTEICKECVELYLDMLEVSKLIKNTKENTPMTASNNTMTAGNVVGSLVSITPAISTLSLPIPSISTFASTSIPTNQISLKTIFNSLSGFDLDERKINIKDVLDDNPYGLVEEISLPKAEGMMGSLYRRFGSFVKMNGFESDWIFLFMNANEPAISSIVEKYIEENSVNKIKEVPDVQQN